SANINDRAGNSLGATNFVSHFTVKAATAVFVNPTGGNWDNPANWDTQQVPGANDDVLIDTGNPSAVVTFRQGNVTVRSLVSNNPLTLTGGVLNVTTTVQVNNAFTLAGGTLKNATVMNGLGGQGLTLTSSGGTLSAVTIAAGATLDGTQVSHAAANISGGLILNGTLNLGKTNGTTNGQLRFAQTSQTLGGLGTVVFGGSISNAIYATGNPFGNPVILTIGSGITIQGGSGVIGGDVAAADASII